VGKLRSATGLPTQPSIHPYEWYPWITEVEIVKRQIILIQAKVRDHRLGLQPRLYAGSCLWRQQLWHFCKWTLPL